MTDPESVLRRQAAWLAGAGRALAELGEGEPFLAADLGLEVSSLEARLLLGSGMLERIGRFGVRAGPVDLGRLERLETLVTLADARVAERLAAIEAKDGSNTWQSIAGAVSLAGGIVSIARQVL